MSLEGAISRLQYHARSMTGIKDAPDYPPEQSGVFPFCVCYPATGSMTRITDESKGMHTLFVEIHFDRSILGKAIETAVPYIETYSRLIIDDPRLNGQVDVVQMGVDRPISYEFGRLEWGGLETIGIRFSITVKIERSL